MEAVQKAREAVEVGRQGLRESTDGEILTEHSSLNINMAEKKRGEPFTRPCGT
jgi:hypothetical protein